MGVWEVSLLRRLWGGGLAGHLQIALLPSYPVAFLPVLFSKGMF